MLLLLLLLQLLVPFCLAAPLLAAGLPLPSTFPVLHVHIFVSLLGDNALLQEEASQWV